MENEKKTFKPFSMDLLTSGLKAKGLDVAEDVGRVVVEGVFEWAEQSIVLTPNKFDDMALALLPVIKKYLLKKIDKLDGEVDEPNG